MVLILQNIERQNICCKWHMFSTDLSLCRNIFFVVFFYIRKITSETGNISRPWFFVCLYIHMPGSNLTMYNTAHTDNIFVFFCYPWSIRGKKKKLGKLLVLVRFCHLVKEKGTTKISHLLIHFFHLALHTTFHFYLRGLLYTLQQGVILQTKYQKNTHRDAISGFFTETLTAELT